MASSRLGKGRFEVLPLEARTLLAANPNDIHPTFIVFHPPAVTRAPQPHVTGSTTPTGLTPAEIRGAYGVPGINFSGIVGNGAGQTIAIIDAYDAPTVVADLHVFDQQFGLPDPPSFQVLNQNGLTTPLPPTDPAAVSTPGDTWEVEIALDVQWVHAMAPQANIILFEANDNSFANLLTAEDTARNFAGVSVISNSWGAIESQGDNAFDSHFVTPAGHQPVTVLFSAGDDGAFAGGTGTLAPDYPASSPNVVSVGGTALNVNGNNYGSESGWGNGANSGTAGGGGGGISALEPQPLYQRGVVDAFSTTFRTYPDVAMVADPATGASVYDSFDFGAGTGWLTVGGTSLACPLWAGLIGIANQGRAIANAPSLDGPGETLPQLYHLPGADFHDITNGDNGYPAGAGYDLVTGRGTPRADLLVPDLIGPFIGDVVFNDVNIDGIQNDDAGGVSGVTVLLKTPGPDGVIGNNDDTTVASTVTDATGSYAFSRMAPGNYYVNFTAPSGFNISPPFQGGNSSLDSNADPVTGNSGLIVVTGTTSDASIDCGMFQRTITITDVSKVEGNSGVTAFTFTVTLAPSNPTGAIVNFNTINGTATLADNDYQPASGTLTFAVGELKETITVNVVGDTNIENDETFAVNITAPPGFIAIKSQGTGTIINDDFPSVTVSDFTATRSTDNIDYPFVVTLSAPAPFPVLVPMSTEDNTAVRMFDFDPVNTTLTFSPNELQQTITVTVLGSTKPSLDKTFFMAARASTTVVLGTPAKGVGTIISNVPPQISADSPQVTESLTGQTNLPFTIRVDPSLTGTVTVDFVTRDGTAVAGVDYQSQAGTLTFTPGRIVQTVLVPVFRRFLSEADGLDKTLTLTLSNVTGVGTIPVIPVPTTTGTIHNIATVALPFSPGKTATYTDYLNHKVTVGMAGVGRGSVVFIGASSSATDAYEILLDGSNAATSLSVRTSGGASAQTSFSNIIVTGSLASISGKSVNLLGQVNVAGSLNGLALNFVQAGNISVGGGAGNGALAINFGRALDTSITSTIPISSIVANAYLNTDGVPDLITAPSIGTIKVKGSFGGTTIITGSVAAVIVGGSIENSSILASKRIGVVAALGGISGSTIFAGIRDTLTTALPSSADDFVNKTAVIGRVIVRTGGFSNTLVAGWRIGALSLGNVQTANGGSTFGVTADRVGAVNAFTDVRIREIGLDDPTRIVSTANFVVRSI